MSRHHPYHGMRTGAFLLTVLLSAPAAGRDDGVDAGLELAVLGEHWSQVVRSTEATDPLGATPVLRALRAHSLMLTNRNNEALVLFLSLDGYAQRLAWSEWTADLLGRHPETAVAYYLRGDSLARNGDWEAARQSFASALGVGSPRIAALRHPAPARIADGVALTHLGRVDEAVTSFKRAISADGKLAEAYVSLGNLQLVRHAAQGAERSYERALALSPNYALALNGLACAQYGLAAWDQADLGFIKATSQIPLALFVANRRALHAKAGLPPDELAESGEPNPGMQLTVTSGLVDQQRYKNGLTPAQIAQGQWNMDHIGRPITDVLASSGIPLVSAAGAQLNRHLDMSMSTNARSLAQRDMSLDDLRPGGVSSNQSHAFVDDGNWPVANWFGLAQSTEAPGPAHASGGAPK